MGRHLLGLSAVAALALLLGGCGSNAADEGPVRIDEDPFRISFGRVDGKAVLAQSKDALRYRLVSGVEHRLTELISLTHRPTPSGFGGLDIRARVATDEPGRIATVSIVQPGGTILPVHLSVVVSLVPAKGVREIYDSFDASPDAHFVGGGEVRDRVDLRGAIVPIKVSTDCGYAPVPFFASTDGWGLSLESPRIAALAFPGSAGGTGCRFGDEPACTFPALADRVEVCQLGARLRERFWFGTIPTIVAGTPSGYGSQPTPPRSELELIKWRDEVSGPEQVLEDIDRFQAAGIPLGWLLVDNPWEACVGSLEFDPARFPDPAGLIRDVHARGVRFMLWVSPKIGCYSGYPPEALLGDPADQVEIDLRDRKIEAEFRSKLQKLRTAGIDGVKADRADEVDLQTIDESYQNIYPELYARAVMDVLPAGSAAIFRAATKGSQRFVPGLWAGDQDGSFDGLREAIYAGQSAAMSGFSTWGSDIGGYRSEQLTEEVFARWAQFGAVSPIMEVGGIGANATPWTLGRSAMSILKNAAILHYELFPYLYGLILRNQPVLRPLGYGYPDDPEAWKAGLEFLVGPDLLAAPVTGGGTTPSVYLPEGSWVDLYTGRVTAGGRVFIRETPLSQFPFYARDGAVLPFNLRTADSWWGVNEQTHEGRAGWLATNFANLRLRGQPQDVQIFVPAPSQPLRVTLGGHRVAWTWNDGPLPGVVVRVHGPTVQGKIVLSRT